MKTVRDACQLQPNALSIKLSDQIEQLDELITAEGDGAAFFEKTHITQGMQDLISEGIARLAGASSQAIFHLKQAMGGGKTHLLVGFGLLAKHPELAQDILRAGCRTPRLSRAPTSPPSTAATTPTTSSGARSPTNSARASSSRRSGPAAPRRRTRRTGSSSSRATEPILILLDEMPPYFHYLRHARRWATAPSPTSPPAPLPTCSPPPARRPTSASSSPTSAAAYDTGAKLINRALEDARAELGRQERNITPVDLAANEIYDILRKRLFKSLPDKAEIEDIAEAFGRKLEEAAKSKTANRGAEAIADEIAATYPFHPRLKNVIALFKENEQFKQTRGLIELVSRLLKSVWERQANDVFLIGPQHFDLSIPEVRDKLTEISGMRDVIAKDLWDAQQSAHAQIIDLQTGKEAATQVGALLLTASLSTAVNAVKGLTREEMVECLVSPLREPSDFLAAFEELEKVAWYLHHTPEGRYYFDRQENLTKLLQSLAHDAPENQVDDLIRHRLREMFKPSRKTGYEEVLPLPKLEEVADRVRKGRVLLVVSPDSKIPPEEVQKFFEGLSQKNNLCVLTGDKTAMGSVEKAARQLFAAQKADGRIPKGHPQREDLERKQQTYEQDFNVHHPQPVRQGALPDPARRQAAQLASKAAGHDPRRHQALQRRGADREDPDLQPAEALPRRREGFRRHPRQGPGSALAREPGRGPLVRRRRPLRRAGRHALAAAQGPRHAQVHRLQPRAVGRPRQRLRHQEAEEEAHLGPGHRRVRARRRGQGAPARQPAERRPCAAHPLRRGRARSPNRARSSRTRPSPPTALRVNFLVCDPSGQYETGDPVTWSNKLVLRNQLSDEGGKRSVELFVAPRGTIRYTLDGSEPREGIALRRPVAIGDGEVLLRAFAEADGLEAKAEFRFPAKGKKGVQIDDVKPGRLVSRTGRKLDSRGKTFEGLKQAAEKSVTFEGIVLTVGQGNQMIAVNVGEIAVDAAFIEALLAKVLEKFTPDTPVTMTFRKAHFASGHDLKDFAGKLGIELQPGDVEQ